MVGGCYGGIGRRMAIQKAAGTTGTPFNPLLNAGGSSGGSAVALITHILPLCTGSDTVGSLRIPAALCGVMGLRPSLGVVANDARPLGWSAISVLGPMACAVADTVFMLSTSTGCHTMDPLSVSGVCQCWPRQEVDLSGLRIGTVEDFGVCAVDPGIDAASASAWRRSRDTPGPASR